MKIYKNVESKHQTLKSKTIKKSGTIENVESELHILNSKIWKIGQASNFNQILISSIKSYKYFQDLKKCRKWASYFKFQNKKCVWFFILHTNLH